MDSTWIDIFLKGGYTMLALFICSIISLAIIFERLYMLRSSRVLPKKIMKIFDRPFSVTLLQDTIKHKPTSVLSRLLSSCVEHASLPKEQNIEAMERHGRQSANELESGLSLLEIIAMISPLLGLLGTVLGLLDVFNVISVQGVSEVKIFSGGISKALVTTIAGLSIAIPTMIAHSLFRRKIANMLLVMESCVITLISKIYHDKPKSI